jgi:hypothetical protein
MHLVLRDQPRCELLSKRGIALVIDKHEIELGAPQPWQSLACRERQVRELRMLAVDDLGPDFFRGLGGLAGGCGVARERQQNADFYRLGRWRGQRSEECSHHTDCEKPAC